MWTNLVQYNRIVFNLISHQSQLAAHGILMNPKALQVAFLKLTGLRICQDFFDRVQDNLLKLLWKFLHIPFEARHLKESHNL